MFLRKDLGCQRSHHTHFYRIKEPTHCRFILPNALLCLHVQFFVAVDYDTKDDRLWYEKYSIRKPMLPSFISMELGTKVPPMSYVFIGYIYTKRPVDIKPVQLIFVNTSALPPIQILSTQLYFVVYKN